jgi:indole-3-glycerol phosphate synthase
VSQAISEGDGISLIALVGSAEAARAAEEEGAEGIAVSSQVAALRDATSLPILWRAGGRLVDAHQGGADAFLLVAHSLGDEDEEELRLSFAEAAGLELECVVEVHDEEQLQEVLERVDPEILVLSARGADDDDDPLDHVLELLPDVPAGKLAIADVAVSTREDVLALERAGMDGVLVEAERVAELVGGAAPEP